MSGSEEKFFEELARGNHGERHHAAKRDEEDHKGKMLPKKPNEDGVLTEGKLTIDVYQTLSEIVVESAIAGVSPEDLDINVSTDSITIKGERHHQEEVGENDYFYQECYWGRFSRSVILPEEIDPEGATVSFKNGILTVRLPKESKRKAKKLKVKVD